MSLPLWASQQAFYGAMNGNVSDPVYDDAPEDTSYPYWVIGEQFEAPALERHDKQGSEITQRLHYWSDYAGKKEASEALAEADAVLHRQALTVTGYRFVGLRRELAEVLGPEDIDGKKVWHGLLQYIIRIEET